MVNINDIQIEAFHPGEFLKEELQTRGILMKDAAGELKIYPHHLSEIFAKKRDISLKLAFKLEKYLGISAEYWLNMQLAYDIQEYSKSL